jgi:Fumarylacetoacetate (FAA) hydrolase family
MVLVLMGRRVAAKVPLNEAIAIASFYLNVGAVEAAQAPSSLIGPGQRVLIRHPGRRTDHEIELVAVIGMKGRDISRTKALDHVARYTIGLGMTIRGPEERSLRKSLGTSTVVGPSLVRSDEVGDPAAPDSNLQSTASCARRRIRRTTSWPSPSSWPLPRRSTL